MSDPTPEGLALVEQVRATNVRMHGDAHSFQGEWAEYTPRLSKEEAALSIDAHVAKQTAALTARLTLIADFIEPHWRGAGLSLCGSWLSDEIIARSLELARANEDGDGLRAAADGLRAAADAFSPKGEVG